MKTTITLKDRGNGMLSGRLGEPVVTVWPEDIAVAIVHRIVAPRMGVKRFERALSSHRSWKRSIAHVERLLRAVREADRAAELERIRGILHSTS